MISTAFQVCSVGQETMQALDFKCAASIEPPCTLELCCSLVSPPSAVHVVLLIKIFSNIFVREFGSPGRFLTQTTLKTRNHLR